MGIFKNLSGGNNSWNLAEWLRDGGQYDACQHLLGVLDVFHTYYIPAIILLGLVGNLLSCIVFLNTHLRLRSSSYYLAALAVADFGFLAVLLLVWLNNNSGLRLFDKEGWCQCLVYLSSVCSFLSVWLIVAFTVERFIAVQYPLHRPHVCTVARAKAIVTGLVSFAFVSHGYSFVTAGLVRVHGVEVCELREGYDEAMRFISIVDSLMTLVLPLGLILLMNGMITRNLVNFGRGFKRDEPRSHVSSLSYRPSFRLNRLPTTPSSYNGRRGDACDVKLTTIYQARKVTSACKSLASTNTQQSVTKMLLLISTVFVILNFPSYVIRLYVCVSYSVLRREAPSWLWCVQQMFMLLYYTNFSVNFLLYSMCGITFRRCLCQLLTNKLNPFSKRRCFHVCRVIKR